MNKSNILDYLKNYGHLTGKEFEFNNIDGLVLSRFSYIPLDGIVSEEFDKRISVKRAMECFLRKGNAQELVYLPEDMEFIKAICESRRFSSMRLSGYMNSIDIKEQKQFSAVTVEFLPAKYYVSFRGTDNTFVGFKEDFYMCLESPIPSQKEAVDYFNLLSRKLKGEYVLGGHSKGGNIAIYAGAFCNKNIRKKILRIYNIDGPGFSEKFLENEGYLEICPKIYTFVPQSSVVGKLMERRESEIVIHSTYMGILQHDIYSWEVDGNSFVHLEDTTIFSKFVGSTIKQWTDGMDLEQRQQFIDIIFKIIYSTDAKTVDDFALNIPKNVWIALKFFAKADKSKRHIVYKELMYLIESAAKSVPTAIPLPKRNK